MQEPTLDFVQDIVNNAHEYLVSIGGTPGQYPAYDEMMHALRQVNGSWEDLKAALATGTYTESSVKITQLIIDLIVVSVSMGVDIRPLWYVSLSGNALTNEIADEIISKQNPLSPSTEPNAETHQ